MVTLTSLAAMCRRVLRVVRSFIRPAAWPAVVCLLALPSFGDIVYNGSSVVFSGSAAGGLSARATFTVDPVDVDILRLRLENTATGTTPAPSSLLTSFYFNVLSGTLTGTSAPLTYWDAQGTVFRANKTGGDDPVRYMPPITSGSAVQSVPSPVLSNLQAFNLNDDTWQFRTGMSLVASQPPLAFGVGTVGNSQLNPDNFNGNIVGGFNFGIYVGDVATQNLDGNLLVKDRIDFAFKGFKDFRLSQVSPHGVFGYGTKPDAIVTVPEPATLPVMAGCLLAAGAARRAWKRRRLFRGENS